MRLPANALPPQGWDAHVDLLLEDYRDLRGRYDKLVSIEMVEAIGAANLDTYFGQLGALLKPGGLALGSGHHDRGSSICAGIEVRRLHQASHISRQLHSLDQCSSGIQDPRQRSGADSYGRFRRVVRADPKAWRERFLAQLPKVRAQGFDERFVRQLGILSVLLRRWLSRKGDRRRADCC